MLEAVARSAGSIVFLNSDPWGLRPRLYAVARSAGLTARLDLNCFPPQLRCAVIIRGVFVRNYQSCLPVRLYLNHGLALVITVVEMGFNSPARLIVFEHKQTSLLAKRACAGQSYSAGGKPVLAGRRVELE